MSRHCKKLERKISKKLGEDRFGVFYLRFLNVTTFLQPEGLQNILFKNCPKVAKNIAKKLVRIISKKLGEDRFGVFYL